MDIFKGIDLNDSFVLGWNQEPSQMIIEIEASVWPDSSFYRTPKNDEYTCYRRAKLVFRDFKNISGFSSKEAAVDPSETIDYGNIDCLYQAGAKFKLCGDFGEAVIEGGSLLLVFHET